MIARLLFGFTLLCQLFPFSNACAQVYEKVVSLSSLTTGRWPEAALIQARDGNFYGVTNVGGAGERGTVFRYTPEGKLTTLVNFTGANGAGPQSTLIEGGDGFIYGTTSYGGSAETGTVFKISTTGIFTTLQHFTGPNGRVPSGGIVAGNDGNFYGVTSAGGMNGKGTLFRVSSTGTLTTLAHFSDAVGSRPRAALVLTDDGTFLGTAFGGGTNDTGTVYRATTTGVITKLVDFTGANGNYPTASLIRGDDGAYYGTTSAGGTSDHGTIYRLTTAGQHTVVASLNAGPRTPYGPLLRGHDGFLYGVCNDSTTSYSKVVFRMTYAGVVTEFAQLARSRTSIAQGGIIQAQDGFFYGVTPDGGSARIGALFRLTSSGALTVLANFGGDVGRDPSALVEAEGGEFLGVTAAGGANDDGTIFRVRISGDVATVADLSPTLGSDPQPNLMRASDGNYYGTARFGGAQDGGTIFRVTPAGVVDVLVHFTTTTGKAPTSPLIEGTDGSLYGTTTQGGANDRGTVYRVTKLGAVSVLASLQQSTNSTSSRAALVEGSDGKLYGTIRGDTPTDFGSVYSVATDGTFTTLTSFTGSNGKYPRAGLVEDASGEFYGTTETGGNNGFGTIFKITKAGVLTTLIHMPMANRYPSSALRCGPDGRYYGATSGGGVNDVGTIFAVTTAGVLSTIVEIGIDGVDLYPAMPPVFGTDGNIYGTARSSVWRVLYPGPPLLATRNATTVGASKAQLNGSLNPRGTSTQAFIEYGSDGVNFPNVVPASPTPPIGYATSIVGATVTDLAPGANYYFRLRATNSYGTVVSSAQTFSTLAEPTVTVNPASEVLAASARFNGTVSARNFNTTVIFEWGTDGNSFPNTFSATPGTVSGDTDLSVFADVAGLTQGQIYFYRIVATNAAGTVVSGTQSFTTLTDPVAVVTEAVALDTTSARVFGTVNAKRAVTTVKFEYGTDGVNFPNSVDAVPAQVSGESDVPVSGVLTGLSQGTTYFFRIRATSDGGLGLSVPGSFSLGILSGLAQAFPGAVPEHDGALVVNLGPASLLSAPGIKPAWRFVGEQQWRASGVAVVGLVTADQEIEFRPVPGYLQPLRETVTVISGAPPTVVEREYFRTTGVGTGGISVTLKPDGLAGAQWRLLGEDDSSWRNSGATAGGLTAGVYLVECKPVAGRTTPAALSVAVLAGETSTAVATYFLAAPVSGTAPEVLSFEVVTTDDAMQPYAYVGQLRSDAGVATGFAVKKRVVATAGHVVYDDGRLAYTKGLQWLHQYDAGSYEPKPLVPRGAYVFNGYAAQRMAEGTPGESTPQSQQLDVAAIYFLEDAARGGSSGFLASDADTNEFLESSALKALVGYPVDGIAIANQGRMHATPPANVDFDRVLGTALSGLPFRLYTTTALRSSGGHSGGPLCVQQSSGRYYPAAIFLGGAGQTVVRTIDSQVIDIFNRAAVSGDGGDNNSNTGITQVDAGPSLASIGGGGMKITLAPVSAVAASGGWRIGTGAFASSGQTLLSLTPGTYTVEFKPVAGCITPADAAVTVLSGKVATGTFRYTLRKPILSGAPVIGAKDVPIVVQPTVTNIVENFTVEVSDGETLASLGLTLNAATGRVSGTPTKIGSFSLTFTGTNVDAESDPFTIPLEIVQAGALRVAISGSGSVTPAAFVGETSKVPGARYTLVAKPTRGVLFRDWTGTSTAIDGTVRPIFSEVPTLEFTMGDATELTATFIANPFVSAIDGNFAGFVGDPNPPAAGLGAVTLKLTSQGKVTGSLLLGGKTYKFKGSITPGGHFRAEIVRRDAEKIVLDGTLDFTAVPPRIDGTVTIGAETLSFTALHALEFAKGALRPLAGNYALALPRPVEHTGGAFPQGHGYGSLVVRSNGALKLSGVLGDGEKLSAGGALAGDNTWAFYAEPYKRAGLVAGTLTFHDEDGEADPGIDFLDGSLVWNQPSKPSATIGAIGSRSAPPAAPGNFDLNFSADGINVFFTKVATLGDKNRFTLTPADVTTLSLNAKTGALSGRFPNGLPKPTPFKGVLLPKQRIGYGQFRTGETTGAVEMVPAAE